MKCHSPTKPLKGYGNIKKRWEEKNLFQCFYIPLQNNCSLRNFVEKIAMEIINNTKIIDLCFTRKYYFSLSTLKKNKNLIQCVYLPFLCNYLQNLLAVRVKILHFYLYILFHYGMKNFISVLSWANANFLRECNTFVGECVFFFYYYYTREDKCFVTEPECFAREHNVSWEITIPPLVKNKYAKVYFKYIYFMLSILQIHLHIYVRNKIPYNCTFSVLKSAKLEQLILYLMHFNCGEVLKSN